MGLILAYDVLARARRRGARELISEMTEKTGDPEIGISAVTLFELARSKDAATIVRELRVALTVYAISPEAAVRASELSAAAPGLPMSTSLVCGTALELGYRVATADARRLRRAIGVLAVQV